MVNHAVVSRTNIERMKQVYHQLYKYRDSSTLKLTCSKNWCKKLLDAILVSPAGILGEVTKEEKTQHRNNQYEPKTSTPFAIPIGMTNITNTGQYLNTNTTAALKGNGKDSVKCEKMQNTENQYQRNYYHLNSQQQIQQHQQQPIRQLSPQPQQQPMQPEQNKDNTYSILNVVNNNNQSNYINLLAQDQQQMMNLCSQPVLQTEYQQQHSEHTEYHENIVNCKKEF